MVSDGIDALSHQIHPGCHGFASLGDVLHNHALIGSAGEESTGGRLIPWTEAARDKYLAFD
jgi:hypothetical protein